MLMETEIRSEPDLSLVEVAFLWAMMKGPSELATAVHDTKKKKRRAREEFLDQFAIAQIQSRRGNERECEF